jgi:hypothetical protein
VTQFRKGKSGNPKGRPKGIEDRRTALRALFEADAPKLIAKAIAKALEGDAAALRICLDRLVPPLKPRNDSVLLPGLEAGTLADQGRLVLAATARGDVSPDESALLLSALGSLAGIVRVDDLERRLTALENVQKGTTRSVEGTHEKKR